jgi:hypothetical protein
MHHRGQSPYAQRKCGRRQSGSIPRDSVRPLRLKPINRDLPFAHCAFNRVAIIEEAAGTAACALPNLARIERPDHSPVHKKSAAASRAFETAKFFTAGYCSQASYLRARAWSWVLQ